MKSMTGYGRGTAVLAGLTVTVQVSSVNRKTLDLAIKLPDEWDSLEAMVGEEVRKVAHRGRISVVVELTGARPGSEAAWDETEVGLILDRLADFADSRGLKFDPTPELLWSIANSQRKAAELPGPDAAAVAVKAALADALRSFAAMRAKEGEALLIDFLTRLAALRAQVEAVAARASQVPAAYREQLRQRLRQAELELDLNDERVLKEIALFGGEFSASGPP